MPNPNREQVLANVEAIAERRRARTHCARDHNDWYIGKDGRRRCRTCRKIAAASRQIDPPEPVFGLRLKELEVLQETANGLLVKQIATKLCYSHAGIVYIRMRILQKMGVSNITHAVAKAIREGLIE